MAGWEGFSGINRGYVLELYERFRKDPSSVDPEIARAVRALDAPGRRRTRRPRPSDVPARAAVGRRQPGAVDPPLRPPRRAARSARLEAARRSDAPARAARPHRGRPQADPGQPDLVAAHRRGVEHAGAGRGVPPRLLLDHRLRLRAGVRARGAAVAAPGRRGRTLPRAGRSHQPGRAARPADAGRGVRALPAPHLPGQDALLDRRARHARADPRRGDRRGGRGRASDRS